MGFQRVVRKPGATALCVLWKPSKYAIHMKMPIKRKIIPGTRKTDSSAVRFGPSVIRTNHNAVAAKNSR